MDTSITIPQNPLYPASMDWNRLRREGIQHIEQLSSDIWTDYNLHDPGITILEVLCYAITDLGYRVNMAPADLFTVPGGKPFFTAAEILPCLPVTAFDLRKVLIDIDGVRNAWVEQLEKPEVRYYFTSPISLGANSVLGKYFKVMNVELPTNLNLQLDLVLLKAIYECQDEQSRQQKRDAFVDSLYKQVDKISVKPQLQEAILLYMADQYYEEVRYFLECTIPGEGVDDSLTKALDNPPFDDDAYNYIQFCFELSAQLKKLQKAYRAETFSFTWGTLLANVEKYPEIREFLIDQPLISLMMAASLGVAAMPDESNTDAYSLFKPLGVYTVTLRLENGEVANQDDIVREALRRLHLHRNLCEDFSPEVHIVETIDIGIDLSIAVDPAGDVLTIMAAVYNAIYAYLSPDLPFYSLEQRLNKYAAFVIDADVLADLQDAQLPDDVIALLAPLLGDIVAGDAAFETAVGAAIGPGNMDDYYNDIFTHSKKTYDADPVYQGPLLINGFIDDAELAAAQPRQTLYRSDLYKLIAAVDGVRQVVRLELFKCADPDHSRGNWCLAFPCRCLPQLKLDCCVLAVRSGSSDLAVDLEQLQEYVDAHPPASTRLDRSTMQDLPVPVGTQQGDLTEFTSIQMDFPRTYKIGNTGISTRETALRQAQARQLKGYLLFYDQLLANYLAYLGNMRSLLSVSAGDYNSYQPLYEIPGITDLLLDHTPGSDWAAFTADTNNGYMVALKKLAQGSDADAQIFRDKLLDHLLARFGEAFTDYILQLYRIDRPVDSSTVWDESEGLAQDITDKQNFLKHIPGLGAGRATGFNYHYDPSQVPVFWPTPDTEGVKKRVCAILGIADSSRHTITCEPSFVIEVGGARTGEGNQGRGRYEFYLKPSGQSTTRLLVSIAKFSSVDAAEKAGTDFLNMAVEKDNYGIVQGSTAEMHLVGFWVNVAVAARTTANALLLEPVESADDPKPRLKRLQDLASGNCEDDSFHLIEHILLRPRSEAYTELLPPMIACPGEPEILDPYSFWVTVVVPDWAARFKDESRRNAFMQTFQRELPAHLEVRFCRLSRDAMYHFEQAYLDWLKVLCSANTDTLPAVTDALVTIMKGWDDSMIDYFSKITDK